MTMTVEVGYDDVAGQNLEDLRDEVEFSDTGLKTVKIYTKRVN